MHAFVWALATALVAILLLDLADAPAERNSIPPKLALIASWGIAWLLSWSAFYDIERHFGSTGYETHSRARYVACHARFYLGLVILPVALAWLWCDIAKMVANRYSSVEHLGWVFGGGLLVLCLAFPPLLVRIWPTRPLPEGNLREQLLKCAERAGVKIQQILVWDTHGTMCNAAYAGLLPRWRYILLTDSLLDRLNPHETRAAFCHELGHIRLHHTRTRLAWLTAPLGGWYLANSLGAQLAAHWPTMALAVQASVRSTAPWLELVLTFYLPLATIAILLSWHFRSLSRRMELEADQWAVSNLQYEWGPRQAVAIYRSMLGKVGRGAAAYGSWSHPSMVKRLQSVERSGRAASTSINISPRCGNRHNRYLPN
jgi:STE24 endopeptidase